MISLDMEFKDYYSTLNISFGVSDEEIKKAYKQLAKKYHPDSEGGSEEKFKEIQEAYEVLKDKTKKDKYDLMYKSQTNFSNKYNTYQSSSYSNTGSSGSSSQNKSDNSNTGNQSKTNYSGSQNSNSNQQNYQNSQQNQQAANSSQQNQQANSNYQNNNNQQSYQQKQYNDVKNKNTNVNSAKEKTANKSAKPNESFSDFFQMFFGESKAQAQPLKGADYEMNIELDLEDAYNGTTRKLEITSTGQGQRRLEVIIPAGVREGNKIKVTGEGKIGKNGGENGDLYLKVKLKEHPLFKVDGDDIHSTLDLEPHEAILGAEKEVLTLGSKVEIVIPPQTNHGKILRLRGRGLINAKNKTQGDHFVHLGIKIKEHYSFEELQHYKALKKLNN